MSLRSTHPVPSARSWTRRSTLLSCVKTASRSALYRSAAFRAARPNIGLSASLRLAPSPQATPSRIPPYWGKRKCGEGEGLSGKSLLPTPPPLILRRLFLFVPIRSVHYAQELLYDDTIPDPAVVIKTPEYTNVSGRLIFSSNGTAAGRPPHQSKILGEKEGASRVAVLGGKEAVGVLSFSRKGSFLTNSLSRISTSIASRGAPHALLVTIQLIHDRIHKPLPAGFDDVMRHAHGHPCAVGVARFDKLLRTTEAVPPVPSEAERTRTLKSNSFISFKRG